jgi:hypothetical protein
MVEAAANVIRWSMQGGASIPPCPSGTIYRARCTSDGAYRGGARIPGVPPGPIIRHTWHPGAGIIVTLPATIIQAFLYSGARGHLGESSLPADSILLTSVTGYPTF